MVVSAALFLTTLAFFAVIVFMPVYLQVATGASATGSGVLLLPLLIGATASTAVSGRADLADRALQGVPDRRAGAHGRRPARCSSRIDADTPKATVAALLSFFGVGFGLVSQVLTVAIQNAVDRRDLGIATAAANLFRSLGGAIGVAIFGALYSGASIFLPYAAPVAIAGAARGRPLLEEVPLRGKAVAARPELQHQGRWCAARRSGGHVAMSRTARRRTGPVRRCTTTTSTRRSTCSRASSSSRSRTP